MSIEPCKADRGSLLRWSQQAFALIRRGLGFWLGMTLLVCLAIFAGQRLPLVAGMLALSELGISIAPVLEAVETALKMVRKWGHTVKGIPDGELFWIIKNGSKGTAMAPFIPLILTEEEAWQVLRYVRSFATEGK